MKSADTGEGRDIYALTTAATNRQALTAARPQWIVDRLSPLNPRLSPEHYPELRQWLRQYPLVARTPMSLVYRRDDRR